MSTYEPDRLVIDVMAESPCFLVVSNNFDKHWSAGIDGKETMIYRANHAFQAVTVPGAGRHTVEFAYRDQIGIYSFAGIPVGALVMFAGVMMLFHRNRRESLNEAIIGNHKN